ncbi:MAG TPA: peptidase, partial [Zeimonas sp.]|nr:peptidase [Zeimonas sp.]
ERRALNGLDATHVTGTRRNSRGQEQGFLATVVTGPAARNFVLLYAAKDLAALQRAAGQIREAEASFRPMTAADRSASRPWTVKTVAFPRGGFAELARTSPLPTNAEGQLRLLNGVYGGGNPRPGDPVKVIR